MHPHTPPSSAVPAKLRSYLVTSVVTSLFLLAGTVTYTAVRSSAAEPRPAVAPSSGPRVTVASVEERLLADSDEITGHVEAAETVDLRARVSGHLDSVHFQAGQLVKAGELLFTIDPRWYQAQFDLAAARSEVADREAKRSDQLLAAQAISAEEADARHARLA
jgi:multidrug efflux pump subunit AcrA (membrane-fusion protein)